MSTTTTNFGWDIPQSSDLVKNGATAIAELGQDIDTTMVDLKGGTSGQVLSKASNTDMDFVWVTSDDANAIQNTIVDAKGDLIAASAADTPARLAVGNNGETLVADSSTSTGLRYQGSMAGGKNALINGGMDIWQRGTTTTGATSSSNGFAADRWQIYRGGFAAGSTITRQATGDTTNLPFIQYAARIQRDSGNTSTASLEFSQNLETSMSIPYSGKTITMSFYARKGANFSAASDLLFAGLRNGTGTDQQGTTGAGYTGNNTVIYQSVTLTTTWQRFSVTATIPSNSTEFYTNFGYTPVGTAGAADYYEITGVQVEVGSVATQFTRAGGTIQGELAACQRYYQRRTSTNSYAIYATSYVTSSTNVVAYAQLPVTMRVVPTSVDFSTLAQESPGAFLGAITAVTVADKASPTVFAGNFTSSGMTTGQTGWIASNNSASAFLGFSAEL